MLFDKVDKIPGHLVPKFESERSAEAERVVRELIVLAGCPIYLSFWIVDYLYSPENALASFLIRASYIPFSIFCLFLYKIKFFKKYYYLPYFFLAEFVSVGINILTQLNTTAQNRSIYSNGFHLVAVVAFSLSPMPVLTILVSLITLYAPQIVWQLHQNNIANLSFDLNMMFGFTLIIFLNRYIRLKSMRQNFLSKEQLSIDAKIGENISQISHDVRSPVFALRALQSGVFDSEEGKKVLNISIGRIIELIEDITQHASQMHIVKKEVNLSTFYKECVEYISFLHPNKKIEIQNIDFKGSHVFDQGKLRRVVINLVNNAVKAADKGSEFYVSVSMSCAEGGPSFSVSDSGPGFDNLDQAFTRGHSKFGSTGLGLSFCKNIVEQHGSRLLIVRVDNKTKISFELP